MPTKPNQKPEVRSQKSDGTLSHRGLVALDVGARIVFTEGEELPARINVAPWGTRETRKGRVTINDVTARELPGNQRLGWERVALDFNHNTVPDSDSYRGEPAAIAAMGDPVVVPGEGIYLENIEWTPDGREYVGGRHYIDLSPTLQFNDRGEAVFIHSAAVCRNGAIPGLTLFSTDALRNPKTAIRKSLTAMDYKALICALLGVNPDTATDSDIATGMQGFAAKIKALPGAETFSALEEIRTGYQALNAKVENLTALSADLDKVKKELDTRERDQIIAGATAEGKVIPKEMLEGDTALGNAQLKALCATLAPTVPLDRRTNFSAGAQGSGALTNNTSDEEVRKNLGISEEQWKKFNA